MADGDSPQMAVAGILPANGPHSPAGLPVADVYVSRLNLPPGRDILPDEYMPQRIRPSPCFRENLFPN